MAGAAALLWSAILATGILAGAFIVFGTWLGVHLSDRGLRTRLNQSVLAELSYNRTAASSILGLAERAQLAGSISTPPLRTGGLFEAVANSSLLNLSNATRDTLTSTIFQAEMVNDGLRTMRRFQLSVTTDKAENLRNIQMVVGAYAKAYSSLAEKLEASFSTDVGPRRWRRVKTPATSKP